jgi:hypothetical protein
MRIDERNCASLVVGVAFVVVVAGLYALQHSRLMPDGNYKWDAISTKVPTERDFNPFGGDLDAAHAWREFGGMTLDQAYEHFLSNPLSYQEDFMFMGAAAFLFYFPVIERFLYNVRAENEWDDCQAWILSQGIIQQMSDENGRNQQLLSRVAALVDYVLRNPNQYGTTIDEQERIISGWTELRETLNRIQN